VASGKAGNVSAPAAASKAATSITGGIALDSIPLKWMKYKEAFALIEIIQLCFSPNNNGKRINTV